MFFKLFSLLLLCEKCARVKTYFFIGAVFLRSIVKWSYAIWRSNRIFVEVNLKVYYVFSFNNNQCFIFSPCSWWDTPKTNAHTIKVYILRYQLTASLTHCICANCDLWKDQFSRKMRHQPQNPFPKNIFTNFSVHEMRKFKWSIEIVSAFEHKFSTLHISRVLVLFSHFHSVESSIWCWNNIKYFSFLLLILTEKKNKIVNFKNGNKFYSFLITTSHEIIKESLECRIFMRINWWRCF